MNNIFKKIYSNFAVLSALFITVVTSKLRGYQECAPEQLIHCAKPLSVLTDSGLTFATSKSELERMCPDLRDALKCIHHYARSCMLPEEHAHFKKLFHGTGLIVMELCKNGTYQTEYLKHAPCMKQVEQQNEICLKTYKTRMEEIESRTSIETTPIPDLVSYQKKKREAADEGIKSVCCSFQQYVECSTHTMRRACGEEAAEFSKDFLGRMSASLMQLHCQEYGRRECGLISSSDTTKISTTLLGILSIIIYLLS